MYFMKINGYKNIDQHFLNYLNRDKIWSLDEVCVKILKY
jgi:hypothetical protein